jgi:hypothetical protein
MNPTFLLLPALLSPLTTTEEITIENDDAVITATSTVRVAPGVLADEDGDGVIRIEGNGLLVDFTGTPLRGATPGSDPDGFTGTGVVIAGRNITIKGLEVSGYKVGIHATGCDGLVLVGCDVSDNFAQRLRSTPAAEDSSDWLYPHANDNREWATKYGAGILVERSDDIIVSGCRARRTQNGLILDRVNDSRIFDNDFSFLSGWGIAMWRSCRNTVCRNQTDFCIRGYSHGVYNRGQDSAGILMFEQCQENVIALNSATHCGDGFFGFSGSEALGEIPPLTEDFDYKYAGNRRNILFQNDFSYAAAHGIEMTFSVGNKFIRNRLRENAICGIWAGYSKALIIDSNRFRGNGDQGYGLEQGGINIEHGTENRIVYNSFVDNTCGIHLWWDADEHLVSLPWCVVNGHLSTDNYIIQNSFEGDHVAIRLRNTAATEVLDNTYTNVGAKMETDDLLQVATSPVMLPRPETPDFDLYGRRQAFLARKDLAGREKIIIGEWGPFDFESPLLHRIADRDGAHVYRLLGPATLISAEADGQGSIEVRVERPEAATAETPSEAPSEIIPEVIPEIIPEVIVSSPAGTFAAYHLRVTVQPSAEENAEPIVLEAEALLLATVWNTRAFSWQTDPRTDLDAWHTEAEAGILFPLPELSLLFGGGGPSEIGGAPDELVEAKLGGNRFGIIADTEITVPAGRWRLATRSDDGIRVWVDDELLIDDWTHHAPRSHDVELEFEETASHTLRVEYFELDGHAELVVEIAVAD